MKKLLVALLVLGLAAPAMAAEVGLYGSFRTHLGYYDVDENYGGGPFMDGTIGAGSGFDDQGTMLALSGQSRFGAKAKISDTLNAVFELGLRESTRTSENQSETYLRLAYGSWNFGAGSLVLGKDYTPGTFLGYSNMVADIGDMGEAIFLVAGLPYIGRQPQIKLKISGFEMALIEPNNSPAGTTVAPTTLANPDPIPVPNPGTLPGYTSDKDFFLPRIELAYQFNTPMISLRPVLGYQTYDVVNRTAGGSETDKSIDSWMGGLGVMLRLGGFYANATGSYMVNPGNYGETNLVVGVVPGIMYAGLINDDVEDAELTMATLALGFKFSPTLRAEAGGTYNNIQKDLAAGVTGEQTGYLYYAQVGIALAPGVTVTPEIGMLDRGDFERTGATDTDMGDMTYGVVSFRIDF